MLRTAIIVGGGIGGIPAAIAMCKAGFQVKVQVKFLYVEELNCVEVVAIFPSIITLSSLDRGYFSTPTMLGCILKDWASS